MTKKQHVCIDGLNLSLSKGTGIATYARNLGDYLHNAEYSLSILFDKKINEKFPDALYEAVFYEALNKPSEKERRPRTSIVHYFLIPFYFFKSMSYFFRPPNIKHRCFAGVVENEAMENKLPPFNTIYNSASLYRLAQCYFMLFRRLLPIKLSPTPDIMHWTCPIPMRVVGAKNYYTIHDLIPLRLPYTTQDNKKFFYDLMQKIMQSADKLVTVSEFSRQDIIKYLSLPEEKIINTYQSITPHSRYSVDHKTFLENQLRGQFGLSPKSYFLFVGAIEPKKNVIRLLEGFMSANVAEKLVIAGPLAWQSEKERAMLKKYTDRVIYLNYVTNYALHALMSHTKALLFPSLYEGFGLPVLEAMSRGVPVITSNVSSLPEISGDAALLVNPYDIAQISDAIHQLATNDKLCEELSRKGLARAQDFSRDAYAQRLENTYE